MHGRRRIAASAAFEWGASRKNGGGIWAMVGQSEIESNLGSEGSMSECIYE